MRVPGVAEDYLFTDNLYGRGQVHVLLSKHAIRFARRPPEEIMKFVRGHRQTLAVVEVVHVEPEGAIIGDPDDFLENHIDVLRRAIRRQAHQLVFAGIDLEARVVGEGRVEHSQRVREMQLVGEGKSVSATDTDRACRPFANGVQREDSRLFEGGGEESACRMGFVMPGKTEAASELRSQSRFYLLRQTQLVAGPDRRGLAEGLKAPGSESEVGLHQTPELDPRLFVKDDVV